MSSETNVFISATSSLTGSSFNATSKLSFLWFDRVFVEDLGRRSAVAAVVRDEVISKEDRAFVGNIIVPVSCIDSGAVTRQSGEFESERYPRWEADGRIYYRFPEPETPQQYAFLMAHKEAMLIGYLSVLLFAWPDNSWTR